MTPTISVDLLPDGAVIADSDGRVTVINRVAEKMLGVHRDDAVGKPLGDVLTLLDQRACTWLGTNAPYTGLGTRTGIPEQSWLLPSGEEVLVAAALSRRTPRGPVDQVAVSLRSGRARARLDRERSDLVATVAHELRSPLTGVKGFVTVLLNRWDRLTDDQKKLMLTTVSVDSDRLSRLIAELLDVARIDTGRLTISRRGCDAAVLVTRVIASVQAGTSRPILFVTTEEPPQIFADPDKFTQVITNLVENAVRHGSGTIVVTMTPVVHDEEVGAGVEFTIDDEGEGIAPDVRRRVFTKFWTAGSRGGSGLGMYIVHGLVRAHGGQVTIGDAPGGGARVIVQWPVSAESGL